MVAESYTVVEHLHTGAVFQLLRARDDRDGTPVVLKQLDADRRSEAEDARLRRECEILQGLAGVPGVVRARGLHEAEGALSLVLEDAGGSTLASFLQRLRPDLKTFFDLAIQLADILARVHDHHVIHKDIKPRNILVDSELRVQLIDFGIAVRLSREVPAIKNPGVLQGTLAYISPEQTGRMNRALDRRTDLYSLGVTFYEMLTGQPPFIGRDPMELIHAHIARRPQPPNELDLAIPPVLSELVLKLLAKTAEDRYRSAFGLRADLERCRAGLRAGTIERFPLGEHDPASSFEVPDKLYGREVEIGVLEAVLGRVREGASELVIVQGPAGIGKSAVVRELQRSVSGRGFFIAGKFDPLRRDSPYSALRDALSELVRHLLAESEQNVARWRWTIDKSIGPLADALVSLLPDLGHVLGPQPPLPDLPPAAARARFHRAIVQFCRLFARPRSPLVLFLDDLQWADAASLDLLGALLREPAAGGLLCVISFRGSDVPPGHPLHATLAEITEAGCPITRLDLGPLGSASVARMVADTLARPPGEVAELAELVDRKTAGNAFFAAEFLRDLHRRGLLEFDARTLGWAWRLAAIADAPATANVVEMMVERTRNLGSEARAILQLAACIGGSFELAPLAVLTGRSRPAVEAALAEAVEAGMISAQGDLHRFAHDRVHEAVLGTLEPRARAAAHLRLARLLRAGREVERLGADAFAVAEHARLAGAELRDPEERRVFAEIHLHAARRARAAAAFAPAARFCAGGIDLLSEAAWASEHDLIFNLHLGSAECEFMVGNHELAEARFAALQGRALGPLQQAEVLLLELNLRVQQGQFGEALGLAGQALRLLGEPLPPRPGTATILTEYLRTRRALSGRNPTALLELPPMRDERVDMALNVLSIASAAGFQSDMRMLAVIAMRTTRLALQYGLSSATAANFVTYGMIAGSFTQDDQLMDSYGQLGLAIIQRFPDPGREAIVRFLYSGMVQSLCHPLRDAIASLRIGQKAALDGGYPTAAAYCATGLISTLMSAGVGLEQVRGESEHAIDLLRRARVPELDVSAEITRHAALALLGQTREPGSFSSADFDEQQVSKPRTDAAASSTMWYWHLKVVVLTILGMHDEALGFAQQAAPTIAAVYRFGYAMPEHLFYRSVLLAAKLAGQGAIEQARSLRSIRKAEARLAALAAHNPANFAAMHAIVRAERVRVGDLEGDPIEAYERAIAVARERSMVHHEAFVRERAGEYYLGRGLVELGRMQLARARQGYLRWGARAKVERMDHKHPGVERWGSVAVVQLDTTLSGTGSLDGRARTTGPTDGPSTARTGQALDVSTIIKASQAFAAEIELERLQQKIMRIVVEHAGAERGVLLLEQPLGLVAVAEYSARSDSLTVLGNQPVEACTLVPASAIALARRTGKAIALDDAAHDSTLGADPYIQRRRLRSLLAVPLLHHGKRLGMLYLDNNLATGVFTPQRLEMLEVLAVQAAIAIEHAMFYADLDHARQAAEAANLAKSRFLANMSHELRTPLNAILGYSELLAEEAESRGLDDMSDDLGKIRRAGAHLLALISDILDLTKIEAGKLEVHLQPIVLSALLADVATVIGPEIARNDNQLLLDTDPLLGDMRGDPLKIRQILLNILNNAAKFTEGGIVLLRVRRLGEAIRFEVRDTGIGMSASQLAVIFEPFTQADSSPSRRFGGAGLGLTICRRLCELMGGRIAVTSEPGQGTTFTVDLPAHRELTIPPPMGE